MCYVFEENWRDGIDDDDVRGETFQTEKYQTYGKPGEKDVSLVINLQKTKYANRLCSH